MNERYELLPIKEKSHFQIRALIDMPEHGVKAGDLGGIIKKEGSLPQFGTGWVEEGSSVIGFSIVMSGHVKGNSKINIRGEIACTEIDASTLKGKVNIKGDIRLKNVQMQNGGLSGKGEITDSILKDLAFRGNFTLANVEVKLRYKTTHYITGDTKWENVKINGDELYINANTEFSNVNIIQERQNYNSGKLDIRADTVLKNVTFGEACHTMKIGDFRKKRREPCSIISEQGITIQAVDFYIDNTHIKDEVEILSGQFHAIDSTLSGNVQVLRNVSLENCRLSELAVIDGGTFRNQFASMLGDRQVYEVKDAVLTGDEKLDFMEIVNN